MSLSLSVSQPPAVACKCRIDPAEQIPALAEGKLISVRNNDLILQNSLHRSAKLDKHFSLFLALDLHSLDLHFRKGIGSERGILYPKSCKFRISHVPKIGLHNIYFLLPLSL